MGLTDQLTGLVDVIKDSNKHLLDLKILTQKTMKVLNMVNIINIVTLVIMAIQLLVMGWLMFKGGLLTW